MSANILTGTSNAVYHANRTHLSSSNLKMLLTEPERFEHEWILNNAPERKESPHFDEGSFTHSLILEPEKIPDQYAIYGGLRKAGAMYEAFKAEHSHKTIISIAQEHKCKKMFNAYLESKLAGKLVANSLPEFSATSTWLDVPVKCRYDAIVPKSHIIDVKTTNMPTDIDAFRETIKQYRYDLSAALYCQIAYDNYKVLHDYYWIVISKADFKCAVYKASSATLAEGNALCVHAIVKYKQCLKSGLWTNDVLPSTVTLEEEVEEV